MDNPAAAWYLVGWFSTDPAHTGDRSLATYDRHRLDYVINETNFQPKITLRNAVRLALAGDYISNARAFITMVPFQMLIETRIELACPLNLRPDSSLDIGRNQVL